MRGAERWAEGRDRRNRTTLARRERLIEQVYAPGESAKTIVILVSELSVCDQLDGRRQAFRRSLHMAHSSQDEGAQHWPRCSSVTTTRAVVW